MAHAAEAAGQAIPLPVIRPIARRVADRLLQRTAFETSGIHEGVPRLHLDSPVALRSKVLLLMLTVQSPEPLVLVIPEGSLFGCAQASGNPDQDSALKLVVQSWLHLMGVQDEPEHIEESVADTGYTLFSATMAGVPQSPRHGGALFAAAVSVHPQVRLGDSFSP